MVSQASGRPGASQGHLHVRIDGQIGTAFKSAKAWVDWLRAEFDKAEAEGRAALEAELRRKMPAKGKAKKKWKVRIRVISDSHSIRAKALTKWNEAADFIKLTAVPEKKNQLIVEFNLLDTVPIKGLYHFGWGLARHFITALNIGTMGFFWWRMPQQTSRYYESMEDLETKSRLTLDRNPILKVDWGPNRVLTDQDMNLVASVFAALPGPHERKDHAPYSYYIGGLTFLALNDIHWQCESSAFGNFVKSLQEMMLLRGEWNRKVDFAEPLGYFLDGFFPEMDERDHYVDLVHRFSKGARKNLKITLKEASFMKLFCDAYFLRHIRPEVLRRRIPQWEGARAAQKVLGEA